MLEDGLNPDKVRGIKKSDDTWDALPIEHFLTKSKDGKTVNPKISELIAAFRISRGPKNMSFLDTGTKLAISLRYLVSTLFDLFQIYWDKGTNIIYLFDGQVVKSGKMDDTKSILFAYILYEFNIRSNEIEHLAKYFFVSVKNLAKEIDIHNRFHYDSDNHNLYIYNKEKMLILDGTKPKITRHGTHGIFFRESENFIPFNILWPISELDGIINLNKLDITYPNYSYQDIIDRIEIPGLKLDVGNDLPSNPLFDLARRCNFKQGVLTKRQQVILYYLFMHMIPFVEATTSLPFVNFIGPYGSGKTSSARQLLKLLFGELAQSTDLDKDERTFQSNLIDESIMVYDNVENVEDWFLDTIAAISTGTRIKKRRMHTNFENDEFEPKVLICATCRDPSWTRSDIADRTIPFYFGKPLDEQDYVMLETQIYEPLSKFRDELLTIYYNNVNKVVARIKERGGIRGTSDHRLAETAIMLEIINEALEVCKPDEFKIIMDGLKVSRSTFALQEKSWWDPLIFTAKLNDQVQFTADELLEEFRQRGYEETKRKLFVDLSNHQSDIKQLLGYEKKNTADGPRYSFNKSKSTKYNWEGAYIYDTVEEPQINTNGHLHALLSNLKKGITYSKPDLKKIISEQYDPTEVPDVINHLLQQGELERVPVKDIAGEIQYRRP